MGSFVPPCAFGDPVERPHSSGYAGGERVRTATQATTGRRWSC